jgi:hypothetical protein
MDAILIVVVLFFKSVKMVPIKTVMTTFNSMELFFDMWVRHHEMPQLIVSNTYAKFIPSFWKHLFQKVGTKLFFSTTFHTKTNG